MKSCLAIKKQLLLFFASIVTGSTVAALPSYAATFTFSQASVRLDNFNQIAQDVGAIFDVKGKTISRSGQGAVQAQLGFDGTFSSNPSQVFANSSVQSSIAGTGIDYLGSAKISSKVFGNFFFATEQEFRFNFTAFLDLRNSIDSIQDEAVSSNGNISILLIDSISQKVFDSFNLSAKLNTDLTEISDFDLFSFTPGKDFDLDAVERLAFSGGNEEIDITLVRGSFQVSLPENTYLTVIAVAENQSCAESSRELDICVKVPEPSNRFALISLLGLSGILLLPRIMKQIV
jgi:hypothetical protein